MRNFRTHSELEWHVIATTHFNVRYHQGLEDVAERSAAIAEQIYQPVLDQLELDDFGKTDLILSAEDEIQNGFALPSNQIFIWVFQNDAAGWFIGSEKWLKSVIAHEFQHVAMMNALRTWLGVWNLAAVPAWFMEGAAEYFTEKWRVGRSDSRLKIYTYLNRLHKLDPHDAGYAKVLYLADKYGDSTITRLVHHRDEMKIGNRKVITLPYSFDRAFKKVTGQDVKHFTEDWRRAMNTYYYTYRGQRESVDHLGESLSLPGMKSVRGLAFSPDSSRIAVVGRMDAGMRDWGLYVVDTEGDRPPRDLHYGRFGGNPSWSPDGKKIAISEYHRGRHGSMLWDIRLIDPDHGKPRWLTRDARASDPVWSSDGRYVLYVAHPSLASNLYLTDPSGEHVTRLTNFSGDIQVQDPSWSPDGERIVFAVQEEDGNMDLAIVEADGGGFRKLTNDPAEDLSPLWSADGRWIFFTSFRNTTPNLYRIPAAGGAIIPMTDVAEAVYTTQIMPGTGEVVLRTLADVDTVRVRKVAPDRVVEDSAPLVLRDNYFDWRSGQPDIPIPVIDPAKVPAFQGPKPYRSLGTWRPVARGVFPDFVGINALGVWQDGLGKNMLAIAGTAGYRNGEWGGLFAWINAKHAPFLALAAYRDYRLSFRGYGSGYLLEEMSGIELGALIPINLGHHLSAEHLFGISVRGVYRQPADLLRLDSDAYLGPPEKVRAGRIGLLYQWKSQRPHREMAYLPRNGQGLRARYQLYSSVIYGDFSYRRAAIEYFSHWKIPQVPAVIFLYGIGSGISGHPPAQDRIALLGDPPVYLNPGSALGFLAPFVEVPVIHNLRGLRNPVLGTAAVTGTIELRVPLLAKPVIKVMGIEAGQFTAALFTDLGLAWEVGDRSTGSQRHTYGLELKGNILIGPLPLLTLAYGQAGEPGAWRENDPVTYLELGLISPF
ncbi:hypothetical protein ACFL32_00280 [Candidatus Neomarinimicrobiota bacterium]